MSVTTIEEALIMFEQHGDHVIKTTVAQQVCTLFCVSLPHERILEWKSKFIAFAHYQITPAIEGPGSGIRIVELAEHVCKQLVLPTDNADYYPPLAFRDRSREYARIIREKHLNKTH